MSFITGPEHGVELFCPPYLIILLFHKSGHLNSSADDDLLENERKCKATPNSETKKIIQQIYETRKHS